MSLTFEPDLSQEDSSLYNEAQEGNYEANLPDRTRYIRNGPNEYPYCFPADREETIEPSMELENPAQTADTPTDASCHEWSTFVKDKFGSISLVELLDKAEMIRKVDGIERMRFKIEQVIVDEDEIGDEEGSGHEKEECQVTGVIDPDQASEVHDEEKIPSVEKISADESDQFQSKSKNEITNNVRQNEQDSLSQKGELTHSGVTDPDHASKVHNEEKISTGESEQFQSKTKNKITNKNVRQNEQDGQDSLSLKGELTHSGVTDPDHASKVHNEEKISADESEQFQLKTKNEITNKNVQQNEQDVQSSLSQRSTAEKPKKVKNARRRDAVKRKSNKSVDEPQGRKLRSSSRGRLEIKLNDYLQCEKCKRYYYGQSDLKSHKKNSKCKNS